MKKITTTLIVALGLSACQSLPTAQNPTPHIQVQDAKSHLKQAIKAQFRQNFAYTTTFYPSKQASTVEQDGLLACEQVHDERYVQLAKTAKTNDGLDLSADRYLDEKNALKQEFLACQDDHEHEWRTLPKPVSEHEDDVVAHYLTEPLSLTVVGNYRPMAGQFSALPRGDYRFGAVEMMVNQPILVDFRVGVVYLWADNFALANSTWFDKRLGDKWHNKWLMLNINDGSLPKDFVRDLTKAYVAMVESRFDDAQVSHIQNTKDLTVPADVLAKTPIVIEVRQKDKQPYIDNFVKEMTDKYPMLTDSAEQGEADDNTKPTKLNGLGLMKRVFAQLSKNDELVADTEDGLVDVELDNEPSDTDTDKTEQTDSTPKPMYYGLDGKGRLLWVATDSTKKVLGKPINLPSVTTFDSTPMREFDRLPADNRLPNSANTVNALEYLDTLSQTAKDSDNAYLTAFMYYLLPDVFDKPKEQDQEQDY